MRRKSSKIPVPNPIRKGFIFQFLELSDFPPKNFIATLLLNCNEFFDTSTAPNPGL
jgi:hypothetical protein